MLGLSSTGEVYSGNSAEAQPPTIHESVELRPRLGAGGDAFGFAVDIENDVAVVGAAEDSEQHVQSGAVYVFERNASGAWIETTKLFAQDSGPCQHFGSSVALDGNRLVIGQTGVECPPDGDLIASSVYVFERRAAGWVQSAKLQPPSGARFNFAFFTALDRKIALAGQEKNAYAYTRQADRRWSSPVTLPATEAVGDDEYSGPRLDVSGNTVVLGSTGLAIEAAFVDIYQAQPHGTWRRATTIAFPRPGTDFWGRPHVAIEGNVLLADRFVYERKANGAWRRTATLLPADAPLPDEFPGESALSSRGVAVLTAFEFIGQDFPTTAYVYKRMSRGSWTRIATLSPAQNGARFFGRVDTDGRSVIAGGITAHGERVAYIFEVPRGAGKSKGRYDQSWPKDIGWSE
ncbi:MAG TPA: FG-GAP repeat protein [Steroidobacter sp.]